MEYCLKGIRSLCGSRKKKHNKASEELEHLQNNVFLKNRNLEKSLHKYNTDSYHEARKINPEFFDGRGYTYEKWERFTKEKKMDVVTQAIKARQLSQRRRGRAGSIPGEDRKEIRRIQSLFGESLGKGGRRKTRRRRN
jgi:hypothetical protein